MREAIGSTFLYNIIILFLVVTFCFLAATLSYMKSFKMNGKIANVLEKYEGYNVLSYEEIETSLSNLGYRASVNGNLDCPKHTHNGIEYDPSYGPNNNFNSKYKYCVYEYPKKDGYFTMGIITYIYMDIPIVGGTFALPIYAETERIFEFSRG